MNRNADDLDRLRRMLDAAQRIVFFTGAGISTESGIPDFRSPGTGLWTKMKPTMFQDFVASDSIRQESWRRLFTGERVVANAKPNKGHEAIAKLVRDGKAAAVITQNVDSLHQKSGIDPNQIIELHGNVTYAKCLDCEVRYELEQLERQFTDDRSRRAVRGVRRHHQDRDDFVRTIDAGARDASRAAAYRAVRPVRRGRLVAGRLPGGRFSRTGEGTRCASS